MKNVLANCKGAQAQARTRQDRLLTAALVKRYSRAQDAAAEHDFAADWGRRTKSALTPDLQLLAAQVVLTERRR